VRPPTDKLAQAGGSAAKRSVGIGAVTSRLEAVSERRAVRRFTITLAVLGCLLVALAVALIVVLAWGLHTGS